MKMVLFLWQLTLGGLAASGLLELEYVRVQYVHAATDRQACQTLISRLQPDTASCVHRAYLGACQAMWAQYTANPFSKLSTFKKGIKNIESAVQQEPDNVEIRFVRLAVQKNSPAFLGYHKEIKADESFLRTHQHTIASARLKQMVQNLLNE